MQYTVYSLSVEFVCVATLERSDAVNTDASRMDISHQHVLVTGAAARPREATPGIGYAIAHLAGQRGHHVTILDISSDGVRGAEAAFASEGLTCASAVVDIADPAAVDSALRRLVTDRPVSALVNAAALLRTNTAFVPFTDMDPADIQASLDVNLLGVLNTTRAVLPGMLQAQRGVIINIGSIAAAYPAPGLATYALTKAAVRSVTATLAAELGRRGVHVQGFAPGVVQTGLHDHTPTHYQDRLINGSVRGRPASIDEVAHCVIAAVEAPDAACAGQMTAIDGGLSPYGVVSAR